MPKQINVEIIAVSDLGYTKTTKGGYNTIEVAYKEDGAVKGKKFLDFNHPDVFKFLKTTKSGDKLNVVIEKEAGRDGKEYWQWISVSYGAITGETAGGVAGSTEASSNPSTANKSGSVGRVTGSNYETPQERAARQRYIVRQSSLTTALEFLKSKGPSGVSITVDEVVRYARQFEAFVFGEDGISVDIQKEEAQKKSTSKRVAKVETTKEEAVQEVAEIEDDIPY